jgi:hypothetical protein
MVLKILSFLFILYLLYRFIGFFFKVFYVLLGQRPRNQASSRNKKRPEGSIHVEQKPPRKKEKQMGFRGGEYVDYEELDK